MEIVSAKNMERAGPIIDIYFIEKHVFFENIHTICIESLFFHSQFANTEHENTEHENFHAKQQRCVFIC